MKFLVDENIPHSLINFLKSKNHQTIDLKNSQYRGINDLEILKISEEKGYIILTFDKDFLVLTKKGGKLKCLILNLKTINIKYLTSYLEMIFRKYKKVFKRKSFLIYCKKEEVIII